MRKILLTLVFTIFVIPSAFPEGGGHTVGNGGGLPEIELTKIWSSLENTLKPCLNTLWGCGAYGVHKQKLQKGLEDKASCGTKLKFQVLEGQEPFERGETCKTILVDQKALYSDGKKPISDQALMILAVKMLVTEAYGPSDKDIENLVRNLGVVEHYSEYSSRQLMHKFLVLNSDQDFASVENGTSLVMLNRHLYNAVDCQAIESFELKSFNVQTATASKFDVRGTFDLQCGTEKIIRSFKMILPLNDKSQILEDYIEVTFN